MAAKKAKKVAKKPKTDRRVSTKAQRLAIVTKICDRLRVGGCSIREACRQEGVAFSTVQVWGAKDPDLNGQYAQARAEGLAIDVDAIHELAATRPDDAVHAASLRLQVDTLKWDVCKRIPKVYGEKQQVEHTGALTLSQMVEQSYSDAVKREGEE